MRDVTECLELKWSGEFWRGPEKGGLGLDQPMMQDQGKATSFCLQPQKSHIYEIPKYCIYLVVEK